MPDTFTFEEATAPAPAQTFSWADVDPARAELKALQDRPNYAGAVADAADVATQGAKVLAHPFDSAVEGANYIGHWLKGIAMDAATDNTTGMANTKAAFASAPGTPLPSEGGSGANLPQSVLGGTAETVPAVVAMLGLTAAGVPAAITPGLALGAKAYHDTGGDAAATAKAATLGLAMGPVSKFAEDAAAKALGALPEVSPTVQKIVEAGAKQVGLDTLFLAADSPEYYHAFQQDPEKAKKMLAGLIGVNLALGLPEIAGITDPDVLSATQRHIQDGPGLDLVNHFHDHVDEAATAALDPRNAQVKLDGAPGEERPGVTLGDFPKPGEVAPRELLETRMEYPDFFRPQTWPDIPMPERPETLQAQLQMVVDGKRNAMLVTLGAPMPEDIPSRLSQVRTAAGTFIYNPDHFQADDLKEAVKFNKIGAALGYGIDTKPAPENTVGVVTVRDANGIEKHAVATDLEHLTAVHDAAQRVSSPGDTIQIEHPAEVLAGRQAPPAADAQTPPAPTPGPSVRRGGWTIWAPRRDGVPDVLDAIHEEGGIASPSQAQNPGGEYDGYHEAFRVGIAARLRRGEGGNKPDQLLEQLNENHGFNFRTVDQMYDAVRQAAESRQSLPGQQREEKTTLQREERQAEDFSETAFRPRKEGERQEAGNLAVGDTFKLKGETLTVTDFDPDTDTYTVQDGRTFGRQQIHAEAEFFPDKGSVEHVESKGGFNPEDAPAPAPKTLLEKLESLKVKLPVGTYESVTGLPVHLWNALIDVAMLAVRAGQTLAEAMESGIEWLRREHPDVEFDADALRRQLGAKLDAAHNAPESVADSHPEGVQGFSPKGPGRPTPPAPAPGLQAAGIPPNRAPVLRVHPIRHFFQSLIRQTKNVLAPQAIDGRARTLANILRENGGKAAIDLARANDAMMEWRQDFDRTSVPKDWKFDPAQPLPRNYEFLDKAERNRAALSASEQQLVKEFDDLFAARIAEVQRLAPDALQNLITDYFPHIWRDPRQAAALSAELAHAPLHGNKSFLRQRSVPYILDGLRRGLVPVSDNPVDLLLTKMHQMDKFILAERTLQEAKAKGLRKYLPVFQRLPEGWAIVEDKSSTVNGPPVVSVEEGFDAGIRRGLLDFIQKLGFSHERQAVLKVKGMMSPWGLYYTGQGRIESKFGTPDSVIMHELGHGLDERYGLSAKLGGTPALEKELDNLAMLRAAGTKPSAKRLAYLLSPEERVAEAIRAYLYAPDVLARVAPGVQARLEQVIQAHPELHDLRDIRPSMQFGAGKTNIPLPGFTTVGHWIMPEGAAQVLNNYLSPGLNRWLPYRSLRAASNIMNSAQLGLSAFHLGFTSLDATVSSVAVALQQLATFDPKTMLKGAARLAGSPVAPVGNYYVGKAVQEAMLHPGSNSVRVLGFRYGLSPSAAATVDQVAKLAVTAGLRATADPFYQTQFTRNLVRAFHQGGVAGTRDTILNLPLAIVEQSMRPITEFLVPRQKLGVFSQMAMHAMEQIGPGATHDQVREAMAKAADSTENRMGQMTYDNLFYNRIVKDIALVGFRAYGWQLGKYREFLGSLVDSKEQAGKILTNQRAELTHRMAYMVALPMVVGAVGGLVNYLMTGQAPQETKDYFFPRSGNLGRDGRPQRLMLPSYLKDLVSDWHAFPALNKMGESLYHKLNPLLSMTVDLLRNKDFYSVEIRHEDDPFWKQQLDNARHVLTTMKPFAVSGAQKLHEEDGKPLDYVLPFFGVVPATKALTLTPAEAKAADITQDTLPAGSRTQAEFDHSVLIKTLVRDLKNNPTQGRQNLEAARLAGQLRPADAQHIVSLLTTTPLQYQVQRGTMTPENAMRVWDLANPQERAQLKPILLQKVANSQALDAATRARYLAVLTGSKIPPTPPK